MKKSSARSIRLLPATMGLALMLSALAAAASESTEALATPRTLEVDGTTRRFNLFAPPGAQRAPLVITLHGHGQSTRQIETMTGWNAVAAEHGAVVAYPSSRGAQWRIFGADSPDVDFLLALIERLASEGLVDSQRVFVNGYSGGAQMSWRFACQMPTRVVAAGFVAGAAPDGCGLGHKPALIMFHGERDRSLRFRNAPGSLDIPALGRAWATRAGCEPQESVDALQDPAPLAEGVRRHRWSCDGQGPVELYRFKRGGHHWPGHSRSVGSLSVDATATMWEFFQAQASGTGDGSE